MRDKTLAVIGLGKLGLCTATCFASAGYRVIGIDVIEEVVDSINKGEPHIVEPGISELLKENRIEATTDFSRIKEADVSFTIVPTPSKEDGNFDVKYMKSAIEGAAQNLEKGKYHLFSIVSTVTPGAVENEIKPIIKNMTGRSDEEYGLCYNPEFIALGSVIKNFMNPDIVLIGESDKKAGDILEEIYKSTCKNNPPIMRTNIVNAEIAKISLNTYITMKINYGNMIGELCEKIPGANADEVTKIIGSDTRIGKKYISAGTAYGGPCFPRDTIAFDSLAKTWGVDAKVVRATHEMNEYHAKRIIKLLENQLGDLAGKTVSILGVSYKLDTNVTEESASIKLANELINKGAIVKLHDSSSINPEVVSKAEMHNNIGNSLAGSDIAVIMLPSKEYKELPSSVFTEKMNQSRVLDCWRIRQDLRDNNEITYSTIGSHK